MIKILSLLFCTLAVISAIPAKKPAPLKHVQPFTECGEVFTTSTGEVSSPGYPGNYPDSVSGCGYLITVPEGRAIALFFDFIDVEQEYDYINVYDGTNAFSPSIGEFTGSFNNLAVGSTGNNMYITFKSDYSNSGLGFRATWTTVCGRYQTSPTGVYSSPNYPAEYGNDLDECYGLSVPSGDIAKISFDDFNTEADNDVLTVYDGSSASAPVLVELSGVQTGLVVRSSTNQVFMKFRTNAETTSTGFSLSWTAVCGNRQAGPSGTITSPDYPGAYPNNANACNAIDAEEGNIIQLTFTKLLTEVDVDFVSVYDGEDDTAPLLGRFSGNADGTVVTSTSNVLTVILTSDSSTYGLGYSADYITMPGVKH
ncbi:cubilin-like [Artemia franciscana]|uniref:cubilin-like n=1 Tax=Artemia franciscana TaxID=6661 RepID=UPI0032DBEFFA